MKRLALTDRFDERVEIEGETYSLDLSFDNVLRVFELFSDDNFIPHQKIMIAYEMLVFDFPKVDFEVMDLTIYEIFKNYLNIDLKETQSPSTNVDKFFDLEEDSERIFAAFTKEYGIDLYEQQGKMHIKKFNALLAQLLDRGLKEIVDIRAQKLPTYNKYNADERKHISKLKKLYKLKGIDEKDEVLAQQIDNTFDEIANFFRPTKKE